MSAICPYLSNRKSFEIMLKTLFLSSWDIDSRDIFGSNHGLISELSQAIEYYIKNFLLKSFAK